jgi:hypothetical protein
MNDYMNDMMIDTIQNAKKAWVSTWIKDEALSKPLNDFIKSQTEFTKLATKSVNEFQNAAGEAMSKVMK